MPQAKLFDYFMVFLLLPLPLVIWCVAIMALKEVIEIIRDSLL